MKYCGVIMFAVVAIIAVHHVSARNSTWGYKSWSDSLLYRQNIRMKGGFFGPPPAYNLTFPVRGLSNKRTISHIRVGDLTKLQNGGTATLYNGGIGFKNVIILFKSQTSNGLNMTVEIYGR